MICAFIDCAELTGREDLHEKLAEKLLLPDWYGKNLDALYDCLTEPGEELLLVMKNKDDITAKLGGYGNAFLHVLEDAGKENGRFRLEITE